MKCTLIFKVCNNFTTTKEKEQRLFSAKYEYIHMYNEILYIKRNIVWLSYKIHMTFTYKLYIPLDYRQRVCGNYVELAVITLS